MWFFGLTKRTRWGHNVHSRKNFLLVHASNGQRRTNSPFFWLFAITAAIVILLYVWDIAYIARLSGEFPETGWVATGEGIVSSIRPEAINALPIRIGDRIVAINGVQVTPELPPQLLIRPQRTGPHYQITFLRGEELRTVTLAYRVTSEPRPEIPLLLAVSSGVFIGTGLLIGLVKPWDKVARLGAGFLLCDGLAFLGVALTTFAPVLTGAALLLFLFVHCLNLPSYALGFRFSSVFPSGKPDGRFQKLGWIIYSACFVLWIPKTWMSFLALLPGSDLAEVYLRHRPLLIHYVGYRPILEGSFQLMVALASLLALVNNYQYSSTADMKRRVRWIGAGALFYLTTLAGFKFAELVVYLTHGMTSVESPAWLAARQAVNIALCVLPLTVAFAILKDRLLDIHVVIRRGLQYVLARGALRTLALAPLILLAGRLFLLRHRPLDETLLSGSSEFWIVFFGLAALILKYRTATAGWLDRKFFRTSATGEQMLLGIVDLANSGDDIMPMAKSVGIRINDTLTPKEMAVFIRSGEGSPCSAVYVHRRGGVTVPSTLPEGCDLRSSEWDCLGGLKADLALPIPGLGPAPAGWVVLSEKSSEEPYTATERRLLEAVAAQLSLGYKRCVLERSIATELEIKANVLSRIDKSVDLLRECMACGTCYDQLTERCIADDQFVVLTLPIGKTLHNRYELMRRVGQGGFSFVYDAVDHALGRRIAVKVLVGHLFGDPMAVRRFTREARAAATVSHPNVVAIYDCGPVHNGAFLAMEFLEGSSLRTYISNATKLSPECLLSWVAQLLDGVEAVHSAGVIHRDLKPENIMVIHSGQSGQIKLVDFGIASLPSSNVLGTFLQTEGTIAGTLGYMAPELLADQNLDERYDIFALGVTVYEMMFGFRPFSGHTPEQVYHSIIAGQPTIPVDPRWSTMSDAFSRCLTSDLNERFRDIRNVRAVLMPALRKCLELKAFRAIG